MDLLINYDTKTGDTGTKTATFNGLQQTNLWNKGAYILAKFGTVSGANPTCNIRIQYSYDNGSNWLNIDGATDNITASNQTALILVYPTSSQSTPGSNPSGLTTGATQTLVLNAPLPRTWRVTYTIGGTNPSFALSDTFISYCI